PDRRPPKPPLPWRSMRAAARLSPVAAAAVLVTVSLFFGGNIGEGRLFWIGVFAVAARLGATVAVLSGALPVRVPSRLGAVALGLIVAYILWHGLSIAWSIAPDRSWAYLDRGLVYLSFALLGLVAAAAVRSPAQSVAGALAALLFGVLGWALLG